MIKLSNITHERLSEALTKGVKLPALPTASSELLAMVQQPTDRVNTQKLAELIDRDQGLTAAVLRLVNSPYYGRTRTITHVGRALTIIGMEEALSYLNYYMLRKIVPSFPELPHLTQNSYFMHSWACATAARQLGRPQYLIGSLPGELYLAGLMHDLGKVILAEHATEEFADALQRAHAEGRALQETEVENLGIDHAMLGAHLLDEWNIPGPILNAVAYHHDPGAAPAEHQELAGLTQLADMIANLSGIGSGGNPAKCDIMQSWIHLNGKTRLSDVAQLGALVAEIEQSLRKQAEILFSFEAEDSAGAETEGKGMVEETEAEEQQTISISMMEVQGGHAEVIEVPRAIAQVEDVPQGGVWGRIKLMFGRH